MSSTVYRCAERFALRPCAVSLENSLAESRLPAKLCIYFVGACDPLYYSGVRL